ncbi:MAG: nucleoside triphosphate pyrophosphohydrolase [Alphaproteobacteria bacterium]|nr:nucleoside triphosphate pyrophosphohydrolase [Alphaproteobacteria bacterium]
MAALRHPETGCPWDLQQDFASIAPYTLEEAYEVTDAIERGNMEDLKEELGDLLLQVVFHARMAEEAALFSFGDVVEAISDKMIRRHPHVFGDGTADNADAVRKTWEEIKAEEKASKSKAPAAAPPDSLMNDIPLTLPGLSRAVKMQNRAARIGFDWPDIEPVFDKLHEEIEEVRAAITSGAKDAMEDEVGDLLFVAANIARHLKIDPEKAVRRTNGKFIARFKHVEMLAAQSGKDDLTLEELEAFWQSAKKAKKDAR